MIEFEELIGATVISAISDFEEDTIILELIDGRMVSVGSMYDCRLAADEVRK